MKKLTILFAFLLLCFTAQAQTKSDLIGKWVFDIEETGKLLPQIKLELDKLSDSDKKLAIEMCEKTFFVFKDAKAMSFSTPGRSKDGTYVFEGKTLTTTTDTKVANFTFQSFENGLIVLKNEDDGQIVAFKKVK